MLVGLGSAPSGHRRGEVRAETGENWLLSGVMGGSCWCKRACCSEHA